MSFLKKLDSTGVPSSPSKNVKGDSKILGTVARIANAKMKAESVIPGATGSTCRDDFFQDPISKYPMNAPEKSPKKIDLCLSCQSVCHLSASSNSPDLSLESNLEGNPPKGRPTACPYLREDHVNGG